MNEKDSLEFEPGAALPTDRFSTLCSLHIRGIKTFSSLEPVVDPDQTLEIIWATYPFIDEYKVGKVNHWPEYENRVDWDKFVADVVTLLRKFDKKFYIKKSLQEHNKSTELRPEEIALPF
jgi:hypothetical protein